MDEREVKGVFGALFAAAAFALIVFAGVVVFSPERTAGKAHTPMPLTAEEESLGATEATPESDEAEESESDSNAGDDEQSTNRNVRAKGMFKWDH